MRKVPLWLRVMIGMVLGIVFGLVVGPEFTQYFKPIGQIFINAIQMLVVPLVLATLVCGVAGMSDPASMGRIGLKTLIGLVVFTVISSSLGLLTANLLLGDSSGNAIIKTEPKVAAKNKIVTGAVNIRVENVDLQVLHNLEKSNPELAEKISQALSGANISAEIALPESMLGKTDAIHDKSEDDNTLITVLKNIVPSNPFSSMSKGNILQIIVFALLLGICISLIKERGKPLLDFFTGLAEAMFVMVGLIMSIAPFGVFFLMAWVTSSFGLQTLQRLALVVVAVYLACLVQGVVVYGAAIALSGLNPRRYFSGIVDVLAFAFATSSSAGSLPVSMRCTQNNLGVPRSIASFVLPLCATINMSGTAIYEGVCAVFVAQIYGIELTMASYAIIVATSILAAVGTAGVPGSGLIMLSLVLNSVGLPLEGIALIAGIDRILDMARTTLNVMGDTAIATMVAKSEKNLDMEIFSRIENIKE